MLFIKTKFAESNFLSYVVADPVRRTRFTYVRQSEILNPYSFYTTLQDSTRVVGAESFDQRLVCRGMQCNCKVIVIVNVM